MGELNEHKVKQAITRDGVFHCQPIEKENDGNDPRLDYASLEMIVIAPEQEVISIEELWRFAFELFDYNRFLSMVEQGREFLFLTWKEGPISKRIGVYIMKNKNHAREKYMLLLEEE